MVLFNNIPYKFMRLTSKVNLTKLFSEKYKRMRLITRLYSIQLRSDARPHAIFTPRHITFPLHQQVADELNRMEKAGVIPK